MTKKQLINEVAYLFRPHKIITKHATFVAVWENGKSADVFDDFVNIDTNPDVLKYNKRIKRACKISDELAKKEKRTRNDFWQEIFDAAEKMNENYSGR